MVLAFSRSLSGTLLSLASARGYCLVLNFLRPRGERYSAFPSLPFASPSGALLRRSRGGRSGRRPRSRARIESRSEKRERSPATCRRKRVPSHHAAGGEADDDNGTARLMASTAKTQVRASRLMAARAKPSCLQAYAAVATMLQAVRLRATRLEATVGIVRAMV